MAKPILGVGWDVGGWIGRKQGVAVARPDGDTVEWLGAPVAFKLSHFPDGCGLLDLIRLAWRTAPDDVIEQHRVIVAIDAPLGFPLAFKRLLNGEPCPSFAPGGPEIGNPLAYRLTDQHVFRTFGKKPLSASFDKLGNNATVAMVHARRWATKHRIPIHPFGSEPSERGAIIEVYPALCKRKGTHDCHDEIAARLPTGLEGGSDEGDAAICALMALAFGLEGGCGLPMLVGPAWLNEPHAILEEGWIYYWLTNPRPELARSFKPAR